MARFLSLTSKAKVSGATDAASSVYSHCYSNLPSFGPSRNTETLLSRDDIARFLSSEKCVYVPLALYTLSQARRTGSFGSRENRVDGWRPVKSYRSAINYNGRERMNERMNSLNA